MPAKRHRGKQGGSKPPPPNTRSAEVNPQLEEKPGVSMISSADQNLLQEVTWCLERLEAQMKQQNTPKQAEEYARAWRSLSNSQTALVKKRQIMRSMFGDYRATMEREEKQYSVRPQGMTITSVPTKKALTSKYIRSSQQTDANVRSTAKDFKFSFSLSDDSSKPASVSVVSDNTELASNKTVSEATPVVAENYYHMDLSRPDESTFGFNFSITD